MKIIILLINYTLLALYLIIISLNKLSEPFQVSSPIRYNWSKLKVIKELPFYAYNNLLIIALIN
jgi:hypothetical protein